MIGFRYSYDRCGNPIGETKLHSLTDGELSHYDSNYRLTRFERGILNSTNNSISQPSLNIPSQSNWGLDGVGNWDRVDDEARFYNSFNALIFRSNSVPASLQYDKNGNLKDTGSLQLGFDYRNRLKRVTRKSDGLLIAGYAYDAHNRRVSRSVTNSASTNGITRFYFKGSQLIEERNGTNGVLNQYVYGGASRELLVIDRNLNGDSTATGVGDQRLYYHRNSEGSVFGLTDNSGKLVEAYQYDAYGQKTTFGPNTNGVVDFSQGTTLSGNAGSFGNFYGFHGDRLDPESVFNEYGPLYYSPDLGRALGRDWSGSSGSPDSFDDLLDSVLGSLGEGGLGAIFGGEEDFSHALDSLFGPGTSGFGPSDWQSGWGPGYGSNGHGGKGNGIGGKGFGLGTDDGSGSLLDDGLGAIGSGDGLSSVLGDIGGWNVGSGSGLDFSKGPGHGGAGLVDSSGDMLAGIGNPSSRGSSGCGWNCGGMFMWNQRVGAAGGMAEVGCGVFGGAVAGACIGSFAAATTPIGGAAIGGYCATAGAAAAAACIAVVKSGSDNSGNNKGGNQEKDGAKQDNSGKQDNSAQKQDKPSEPTPDEDSLQCLPKPSGYPTDDGGGSGNPHGQAGMEGEGGGIGGPHVRAGMDGEGGIGGPSGPHVRAGRAGMDGPDGGGPSGPTSFSGMTRGMIRNGR
jgi:hypothetical protein